MRSAGAVFKRVPRWRRGLLTLAGLGCVTYGAWMIYHPAGVIIGGLCVLLFESLQDEA